ncbi:MAG: hypothetical protein KJZ85_06875 [Rhodobacteraceae bacterium]|jgi:transposase-like protein|nr:hypothetical protein [Paracoccaceae bacterium]
MSGLRDFIHRLLPPAWRQRAEAESREWLATCPHCGAQTSVWELGGMRWGGAGTKRSRLTCRACGRRGWHRIARSGSPNGN